MNPAVCALLGRPDVGLLTMTEMADNAGRIAACVDIPVIADADTGYGNPINVIRTVQAYESAGVAAIHIEEDPAEAAWPNTRVEINGRTYCMVS